MCDTLIFATVDVVKLGAGNTVEFAPGALVRQLLAVAAAGAGAVVALLVLAVGVAWLIARVRQSVGGRAAGEREAPGQYDYRQAWAMEEQTCRDDSEEEADEEEVV